MFIWHRIQTPDPVNKESYLFVTSSIFYLNMKLLFTSKFELMHVSHSYHERKLLFYLFNQMEILFHRFTFYFILSLFFLAIQLYSQRKHLILSVTMTTLQVISIFFISFLLYSIILGNFQKHSEFNDKQTRMFWWYRITDEMFPGCFQFA